jgi:hypothetical protein
LLPNLPNLPNGVFALALAAGPYPPVTLNDYLRPCRAW